MTDQLLQESQDAETTNPNQNSTHGFPEFPTAEKSSQPEPPGLNESVDRDATPPASAAGLPLAQHRAIELLALGKSFKAVAKTLEIDRRTLFNWRRNALFQSELHRRHEELWGDATDRLRMLIHPSLEVLAEHLNDPYDRSRFRAATAILRFSNLRKAGGKSE